MSFFIYDANYLINFLIYKKIKKKLLHKYDRGFFCCCGPIGFSYIGFGTATGLIGPIGFLYCV